MRRAWVQAWLVALGWLAVALAYTWPLAARLNDVVPGDQRDPLQQAASYDHVYRSLVSLQWGALWELPFFWHHPNSLAFFETGLGFAFYGLPAWLFAGSATGMLNVILVCGLWTSALTGTLLGWALTRKLLPALMVGAVHGFGAYHLGHWMHANLHQLYAAPLVFMGLWWTVAGPRHRPWGLFAAAVGVVLQVLSSTQLGLFNAAAALPLLVGVAAWSARSNPRGTLAAAAAGLALMGAVLGPVAAHYLAVERDYGFSRSLEEIRGFGGTVKPLTWVPADVLWGPQGSPPADEKTLFFGRVPLLLGAVALGLLAHAAVRWRVLSNEQKRFRVLLGVAALCTGWSLWLSLGLGAQTEPTWSHAYSWLVHHVPGFRGVRVPARFHAFTLLGLGAVAALVMVRAHALLQGLTLVALLLDTFPRSVPLQPLPDGGNPGSALQAVAAAHPRGTVVELPYRLYWRSAQHDLNTVRTGLHTVNGYTGVEPPLGLALRYLLPSFPLSGTDALVRQLGVDALVLHRGPPRADPGERAPWLEDALTQRALPQGFALGGQDPTGAWLEVQRAAPGPLTSLAPLWSPQVRACVRGGSGPRMARVTMPVTHAVVSPRIRHAVELTGARTASSLMEVPAVGLLPTLEGALPVPVEGVRSIRLTESETVVPLVESGSGAPVNARLFAAPLPPLQTDQAIWLRVEVAVEAGHVNAGHVVRLSLEGVGGSLRPDRLVLRTDAAAGCAGVAEGVVEFQRATGTGALRLQLVQPQGGAPLVVQDLPLVLTARPP